MSLNIDIVRVRNADELDKFLPVDGGWVVNHADDRDEITVQAIEESVRNYMDSEHHLRVEVYTRGGLAITGDCPWSGTFVCTRIK